MNYLVPFILLVALAGCHREESPNPDLTVGLTGAYPVTDFKDEVFGVAIPSTTYSARFDISKVDLTHIHVKWTHNFSGKAMTGDIADFELKRDPTNKDLYALSKTGQDYGTITATEINVKDTSNPLNVTEIRASR